MRSTKLISISLPPALLEQVVQLAKEEDRSTSGLCREALRYYMTEKQRKNKRRPKPPPNPSCPGTAALSSYILNSMRKIIAIINQKGGVAKTTTSVNLASGLARKGQRVLVIDLDPQAHSTIGLGIEPGSYQGAIQDILLGKQPIEEVILPTNTENLFLIPSHIRLDKAEQQLTPELFRETFLHKAIENLDYDFIIIDCRPTLGTLTINALYACNFIIVPCEMGRYALDGFSDLMETVDNVKGGDVADKEKILRILLTKYDARNKVSNDWVLEQLKPFHHLLFETAIRKNEAINQSSMAGESIFSFKPDSTGALDYEELTSEFLQLWTR